MNKFTRVIDINGDIYCAYCAKLLKSRNYHMVPEPRCICNCEKAREELQIYESLSKLYSLPIADELIEMKVNNYKSDLISGRESPSSCPIYSSYLNNSLTYNAIQYDSNSHIDTCLGVSDND